MANASTPIVEKLQRVAEKAIRDRDYEAALSAIAAGAQISYTHNQDYTDDIFEQQLLQIEAGALCQIPNALPPAEKRTVLFYDGFGLDTRGLALIFVKALARLGYRVIYVTAEHARNTQPEIHKAVKGFDVVWKYIDMGGSYLQWTESLCKCFTGYGPEHAFFYTTPNDVAAAVAFAHFAGSVTRYQIDLTDHAFWLGVHAFDYCMALRDVGAKIAFHYRKVPAEKIVMLPYYPTIDFDAEFQGFPFDAEGHRVIFSGGALYKTLGDKDNTYYRIIAALLEKHEDIIFLYAGTGDDSQLKLLAERFPQRVYYIAERKDLYQLLRNCVLYMNTYPMFGGLMMHYAAAAGKLPLTLKHNHDADGLLFDQANLQIEYDTMEQMVEDTSRLLEDPEYLRQREARLAGCVITEQRFEKGLQELMTTGKTEFSFSLEPIDTQAFRQEYDRRYRHEETIRNAIATKRHIHLARYFPVLFAKTFCLRMINKLIAHSRKENTKNDSF